jgi:hypothetical protein
VSKRHYNYEYPEDKDQVKWMREQAEREGKTYAQWCSENGIMTEALESRVNKYELIESWLPVMVTEKAEERSSLENYQDAGIGGSIIPSIIGTGKSQFKKDVAKLRPRNVSRRVSGGTRRSRGK